MIRQCLSNKNESATVLRTKSFRELNKAIMYVVYVCMYTSSLLGVGIYSTITVLKITCVLGFSFTKIEFIYESDWTDFEWYSVTFSLDEVNSNRFARSNFFLTQYCLFQLIFQVLVSSCIFI